MFVAIGEARPPLDAGEQSFDAGAIALYAVTLTLEFVVHQIAGLVFDEDWNQVFGSRQNEDITFGALTVTVLGKPLIGLALDI